MSMMRLKCEASQNRNHGDKSFAQRQVRIETNGTAHLPERHVRNSRSSVPPAQWSKSVEQVRFAVLLVSFPDSTGSREHDLTAVLPLPVEKHTQMIVAARVPINQRWMAFVQEDIAPRYSRHRIRTEQPFWMIRDVCCSVCFLDIAIANPAKPLAVRDHSAIDMEANRDILTHSPVFQID